MSLPTAAKVLATLAVLEGDPIEALAYFVSPTHERALCDYGRRLERKAKRRGTHSLVSDLKGMMTRESFSHLRDVHPGWFFEGLRHESPRIIGLACRYLPGDKVRYLIEHLPAGLKTQLPTLGESFAIPDPLIDQVRRILEERFSSGLRPGPDEPFSLAHIPWISARDLHTLIIELGYREIHAGFAKVDAKTLKAFLTRFSVAQAGEIKERVLHQPVPPEAVRREAQRHLATVHLDVEEAAKLPYEIGLSVLAQAAVTEEDRWAQALIFKLEPAHGYVLKRYVAEARGEVRPERVGPRKERLLATIRDLVQEGTIAEYWQTRRDDEDTASYYI